MPKPSLALLLLLLAPPASPAAEAPAPAETADAEAAAAPITEADLRPLFPAGPLARARDDLLAGRHAAAADALARAAAPEARYLRGVALVGAGRGAEAVAVLARLEERLPDLSDRIAVWRGRALDGVGDARAAAAAYGTVRAGSVLWGDSQLARARSLDRAGERAAALDALTPLLSLPPPEEGTRGDPAAEALLLTGQLRAALGGDTERAWARRALVECWAGHPLSPVAGTCLGELKNLPRPLDAAPAVDDALRHAEGLLDANRNGAALGELAKLVPELPAPGAGQPLACRAAFALGKGHRKERQHTRAIEILRPVVERCEDPQLRVRALYFLASAAAVVDPDAAVGWYRALARDYPAHPLADDALFYAADLLGRAGRDAEALGVLGELVERYPQGDFRAEALFRTAWIRKQAGAIPDALEALARLQRDYEGSDAYEYARAAYWHARLVAERNEEGDAARAQEAWRGLAERYPADYYGLLARARLEEARRGSAPPWPAAAPADGERVQYRPGRLPDDRHFRAGVLLLRMGLDRAAAEELGAIDRKALTGGDALLLVAELLDRAGDHKSSSRLVRSTARSLLKGRPEGAALRVWRVAYPLAFRAEVERFAPAAGVPAELLLALMREESGLDPAAMSGAGAVGLTQLMLPTARDVARKLRMGRIEPHDLTRPAVAIRIGATYFGGLLRRYDGSEALALAAYNAGPAPVRNWLRARGALPLDAFVEEIPVQETRGYVKRVLRSYAAYRFLYGKGAARPVLLGQALPPAP